MKFYSEKLSKLYETEAELKTAEEKYEKQLQEKKEAEEKRKNEIVNEKKALAKAVDEADACVDAARENYKKVKAEPVKIIEEAYEKAEKLLEPAENAVQEAQKTKYNAVVEFNKKYGPYTESYTGDKAYNEFKKTSEWFDDLFRPFKLFW